MSNRTLRGFSQSRKDEERGRGLVRRVVGRAVGRGRLKREVSHHLGNPEKSAGVRDPSPVCGPHGFLAAKVEKHAMLNAIENKSFLKCIRLTSSALSIRGRSLHGASALTHRNPTTGERALGAPETRMATRTFSAGLK